MKTNIFTKFAATALCSSILATGAFAAEMSSDDNKIYFGVEGGYSVAATPSGKFKEKTADGTVIGKLKGTEVYEGKIGYKFYPGFSVELAYGYRPHYTLKLALPNQNNIGGSPFNITGINSNSKINSHTVMLNLIYEAQTEKAYRPYFLFGVGYANVTPKRAAINGNVLPAAAAIPEFGFNGNTNPRIGSIKKITSQRLGFRLGTGMMYDITPNVALVAGVKLEYINNIGLHSEFYNPDSSIKTRKSLKKSIGVIDFTIGTRISL